MASRDYRDYSKQLVKIVQAQVYFENLIITKLETEKILNNHQLDIDQEKFLIAWNLKETWKFLFATPDYPLDYNYILYLNRLIMKNLIINNGQIRNVPVKITNCQYQHKMVLEHDVKDQINDLLQKNDPVSLALYVAKTQIFTDGNKRTAIMLINKVLISNDKILNLTKKNEKDLKNALLEYYETDDESKFRNFLQKNTVDLVLNVTFKKLNK